MDIFADATDTLALSETATAIMDHSVSASDIKVITEVSGSNMDQAVDGLDTINCAETPVSIMDFNTNTLDTITCLDIESNNIDFCTTVDDEMSGEEIIYDVDTNTFITIQTGLQDEAASSGNETVEVNEPCSILDNAIGWVCPAGAFQDSAIDTISCTDEARFTVESKSVDGITMFESATSEICYPASDVINCSDSAVANQDYANAPAIDIVNCVDSVSFIHEQVNPECRPEFVYTPFVGSGTGPTPPPSEYVAEHTTPGFRLQFPSTGPVSNEFIFSRNPSLQNKDRLSPQRKINESRNGELIVFHDPVWPTTETLLFTWSVLKKQEAKDLLQWFCDTLGQEIRLIDHENRLWKGIITEPNDPIVHDGKFNWAASFAFQGKLV